MTINWDNIPLDQSKKQRDVDFPVFAQHGVTLKYNTSSAMMDVYDTHTTDIIIGRTRIDRYPVHLDRLCDVAAFLNQQTEQPISVLFGGCSLGFEPRSFARRVLERNASEQINVNALDNNPRYLACMKERILPYEAIALMRYREEWHPFLREVEEGRVFALSDELENSIHIHEAQDVLKHKQIYDVVNVFHIVQHLPAEKQMALMTHLCVIAKYGIAIDYQSARQFAKGKSDDWNDCLQRLSQQMAGHNFKPLNARPENDKYRFTMSGSRPDQSLIFCKEEVLPELEAGLTAS